MTSRWIAGISPPFFAAWREELDWDPGLVLLSVNIWINKKSNSMQSSHIWINKKSHSMLSGLDR